jgi:tungstate transport system substrate-binding protein
MIFLSAFLASFLHAAGSDSIILSTTTSTQDSGLLDVLVPAFEKKSRIRVKTISVGTGAALALAARGEADVVLAHAPDTEKKYAGEGSLLNRRLVMHNDFLLVGPARDPAKIAGIRRAAEAMGKIALAGAPFVSRGDDSGTHQLEKRLWKEAAVLPKGNWYVEAGQGMGATLTIASEKGGYTLTDRATFLAFEKRLGLQKLVEKDPALLNLYSVMVANPSRFPRVNGAGARAFADFILSPEAQNLIRTFGVERYGEPLFFPDAGKSEEQVR